MVRSKTKLEAQFWLAHMIAFPDGRYFATGEEISESDSKSTGDTFNALFDANGKLIRRVRLRSDGTLKQDEVVTKLVAKRNRSEYTARTATQVPKTGSDKPAASEKAPSDLALTLGDIESDRAGNVFVLRHSSPAIVYVFDHDGKYQRKLSVVGPDPKQLAVSSMFVSPGRLALTFQQIGDMNDPRRVISIVDSSTGDELARYSAGPELGSGPVCMTDNELEFLSATPDAALVLDRVRLP